MTTCEYEILVSGYLDGELTAEERTRFVAHLPTCGHCQVLVAHWRAVEGALKRQSAARGEAELADSVQRELTRSGAFRQARRRAWYHRAQDHVRNEWRRYAVVAAVAAALGAGLHLVEKRRAAGEQPTAQAPRAERLFVLPQRQDVLDEAESILAALGQAADEPGQAWIVHARLLGGDVLFWLAQERWSSDDAAFRSRVARLELALELAANLRPERADADGKVVAEALKGGPEAPAALVDQLAGRSREALAKYATAPTAGFRLQASGTATTTASPSSAGSVNRNTNSNAALTADEVAFLEAACRQALGDDLRAIAGDETVAQPQRASRFAAEALVRAGEVCEWGLDSPQRARGYYERAATEYQRQEPAERALFAIGRTYEEEGRVEEAERAYAALGEAAWADRRVRDAALAREDFLAAAASSDEVVLKAFLAAERLGRQPRNRTPALIELIRLTNLHPEAAVAADALAAMVRLHLARGEAAAARQAFDRLARSRPQRLSAQAARSLAPSAAEWLVQDVDRDLASRSAVFPELAGYVAGANVTGPKNGADGDWRIAFNAGAEPPGQGRDLAFTLDVGEASKARPATYPNMGLAVRLEIRTSNEVLTAELRRVTDAAAQAVERLDRAAQVRLPDGAGRP